MDDEMAARSTFDWGVQIRLALVVSVVAAMMAMTLAGHLAERTVICLVIAAGSLLGWHQVIRQPQPQPIPARVRHR